MELNGATPKAIYDFWDRARQAFTQGSEQFGQVLEKQAAIAKSAAEKVARALAEARAGNTQMAYDMIAGHKGAKADEAHRSSLRGSALPRSLAWIFSTPPTRPPSLVHSLRPCRNARGLSSRGIC